MRKLGIYNVKNEIGRGGMARVYLAHHARKPFAVKVLREEAAADPTFVERFRREAAILKELDHPHIVALHDFDEEGERLFLVMDYVKGESLAERLKREKRLPLDGAWPLMEELLSALAYAHGRGVIHRDIKPENVLLDETGSARLTDFGIAAAESSNTLTQTGTRLGTPSYMAPEQIRGQHRLLPQADLYSLGVLFYEMLTGALPFEGKDVFAIGYQHAMHRPCPPSHLRPELPEPLSRLVLQALEKDPGQRPASADAMAETLRAIREGDRPAVALTWNPEDWRPRESVILPPARPGPSREGKEDGPPRQAGAQGPRPGAAGRSDAAEDQAPSAPDRGDDSALPSLLRLGLFLLLLAALANLIAPGRSLRPREGSASISREIARLAAQRLALLGSARLERDDLTGALAAFGQALDKDPGLAPNVSATLRERCIDAGRATAARVALLFEFYRTRRPDEPTTALLRARLVVPEGRTDEATRDLTRYLAWTEGRAETVLHLFRDLPAGPRFTLAAGLDSGARDVRLSDPRLAAALDLVAGALRPAP